MAVLIADSRVTKFDVPSNKSFVAPPAPPYHATESRANVPTCCSVRARTQFAPVEDGVTLTN